MSRWLRWQFAGPRLLLCVVMALGAQLAAGLAVRLVAVRSCAQLLGTRTDVANARVSISDGHILLGRMSVSDPRDANKCLFTAESCEVEVAASPLLTRQVIVSKARMRGFRFGNSAAEAGLENRAEVSVSRWFDDHAVEAARDRLARIDDRFDEKFLDRLESVRRTNEFCTCFPDEIAAINKRAVALEGSADELEQTIAAVNGNPLRNGQLLDDVSAKINALRNELDCLSSDSDKLPERLEEERRAIVAARRHDEALVRGKLHFEALDANLLNAYLLRDQAARQLDCVIAWLRTLRELAPSDAAQRPRGEMRGEDVLFAGIRSQPKFLIRSLQLQGEARILDRSVELRGLVSNLTTTRSLHGEPIQLRLSAKDSATFDLRATIDRTRGRMRDEVLVECREIPLGKQSLGQAEQLQLNVAPSTGSLTMRLIVEGDKLSGDIQLVQKQVRMTPVFACQGNSLPIGESLDQSRDKIGALATQISLDGTIDAPTCKLWSNLGPTVAQALDHGLQQHAEAHARLVLEDARRHVDEQLAELERQLAVHREKFANKVANVPQRIDAMARLQNRSERISVEQAGLRLPVTSILR